MSDVNPTFSNAGNTTQDLPQNAPQNAPEEKGTTVPGQFAPPTQTSKSEAPKPVDETPEEPEHYVHLSNGEVVRAKQSDLPGPAGGQHPHGFWEKAGKVFHIIGIYPVESNAAKRDGK